MRTLIESFAQGDASKRLAIAADVATLLGLSVVTVATALFRIRDKLDVGNTVFAVSQSLLFMGGLALLLALFWVVRQFIGARFGQAPFVRSMVLSALAMLFLSLALVGGLMFYEYISSFRYVIGRA